MAATAKPIQFEFTYSEKCPTCKTEGREIPLGFSLDEGGIVCQDGHRFDVMPGTPSVDTPQPSQKRPINDLQPPVDIAAQERVQRASEARQDELRDKARQGSRFDNRPEPTPPAPAGLVEVSRFEPLSGGDAGFRLILRERHLTAIKAEAEIQRQTPEEYLQQWIEIALDNQWGR